MIELPCSLNLICKGKQYNLIAKNNCLDEINWPNHLRVIKVIKFTKAKSQQNSQTGFKLKKNTIKIFSGFVMKISDGHPFHLYLGRTSTPPRGKDPASLFTFSHALKRPYETRLEHGLGQLTQDSYPG